MPLPRNLVPSVPYYLETEAGVYLRPATEEEAGRFELAAGELAVDPILVIDGARCRCVWVES